MNEQLKNQRWEFRVLSSSILQLEDLLQGSSGLYQMATFYMCRSPVKSLAPTYKMSTSVHGCESHNHFHYLPVLRYSEVLAVRSPENYVLVSPPHARNSAKVAMGWQECTYPLQREHHGRLPTHAVPDQDTPVESQLLEEELDVGTHDFIGHEWTVGAVAMITGIHRQHLAGQEKSNSISLGLA